MLCFFILGCNNSKYKYQEESLSNFLKSSKYLEEISCVVLIPSYGCGTCTQDIINFSKKNYQNQKVLFVFSQFDKDQSYLFREYQGFEDFIVKDKLSKLVSMGLVDNKPVVYFIKDKHIEEIVKFDDSNSDVIIKRIKDSIN